MSVSDATFSVQGDRIDQYWSAEAGIQACWRHDTHKGAERVTSLTKLALPSTNALCFHFDNENTNTRTTESEKPVLAVSVHKRALRKHRFVMKISCGRSRVNTRSRSEQGVCDAREREKSARRATRRQETKDRTVVKNIRFPNRNCDPLSCCAKAALVFTRREYSGSTRTPDAEFPPHE